MKVARARRIWNRRPLEAARLLDAAGAGALDAQARGLRAWIAWRHERDAAGAEAHARAALALSGDTRFASAALAEVLLARGDGDEAVTVLEAQRGREPASKWHVLSIADALVDSGRVPEATQLLEREAADEELRRHCYKRLSQLALESGDRALALRWFREHVGLAPNYLVYASDYVTLAELEIEAGDEDAARETLRNGASIYPRNVALRALRSERFGESAELGAPKIAPVSEDEAGVRRIPVRTPIIGPRTGLLPLLDEQTQQLREDGDVLVLAESPAAAGQGRLLPLELVDETPLAQLLCRFVGKIGPLHSPKGMQGAIMEAGAARVSVAAVAGAAGKLARQRGWFYRVAGPPTAMIDDVAAAMPPNDHHLVFGPLDPDGLAATLSSALGVAVAIVDANHLTGAWVVGASEGVDRKWLTDVLRDNPAGNEDERTPVVLVRRVGRDAAAG